MDIDREQVMEAGIAVSAVGVMFVVLYWIGQGHTAVTEVPWGGEQQQLTAAGGELVVYAIVFFILLMAVAGVVLAYTISEPGTEDGAESV